MKRSLSFVFTIVFIIFISGVIGLCVALPFVLFCSEKKLPDLMWSSVIGMIIGCTATFVFSVFIRNARNNPTGSFVLVGMTIGIGTILASVVLSVKELWQLAAMVVLAETIGLAVTYGMYRYTKHLNEQLLQVQERFKK